MSHAFPVIVGLTYETPSESGPVLTCAQFAKMARKSAKVIRNMIERGTINAEPGYRIRIRASELSKVK